MRRIALVVWCASWGCGSADVPDAVVGSVTEPVRAAADPLACVAGAGDCEPRHHCVDIADECDPTRGGADCPGTCRSCDEASSERTYAETNLLSCSRIRLRCGDAQRPFSDECGCGCERIVRPED